jgi:nucleoside-diphosphate-sugar epimerase
MSKPAPGTWLILGGCGFIGRNLVKYLLDNNLASTIRVVDKRAPFMSFLSPDHKAALLNKEYVEFVQADLSEDDMVDAAFAPPRSGSSSWDWIVNLVAETKMGSKDEFFDKGVTAAGKCVEAAARAGGCRKFIHVSTAAIYKPISTTKGTAESGSVLPWSLVGEAAVRSEEAAKTASKTATSGSVPLVILRPAMCYGPGDVNSLMPRCVIAATYKATAERMDFLWDASVKVSTVSVFDVVRAIYFCARKAENGAGELPQSQLSKKCFERGRKKKPFQLITLFPFPSPPLSSF